MADTFITPTEQAPSPHIKSDCPIKRISNDLFFGRKAKFPFFKIPGIGPAVSCSQIKIYPQSKNISEFPSFTSLYPNFRGNVLNWKFQVFLKTLTAVAVMSNEYHTSQWNVPSFILQADWQFLQIRERNLSDSYGSQQCSTAQQSDRTQSITKFQEYSVCLETDSKLYHVKFSCFYFYFANPSAFRELD